jgi:hypothetical protein
MPRPDALFLPEAVKTANGRIFDRVAAVCRVADPLLEVDRAKGERAYIRKQPYGQLFITRDPLDTIYFPTGHSRSGQQRYRWERLANGTELGFLIEDADARRECQA